MAYQPSHGADYDLVMTSGPGFTKTSLILDRSSLEETCKTLSRTGRLNFRKVMPNGSVSEISIYVEERGRRFLGNGS